jgi:hypothetical protein
LLANCVFVMPKHRKNMPLGDFCDICATYREFGAQHHRVVV